MVAKSITPGNKGKSITFRITNELWKDFTEAKAKCEQHGLRVNITEGLTAALEREIKALQKHVQGIEPGWMPGQLSLPAVEEVKKPRAPRKHKEPQA